MQKLIITFESKKINDVIDTVDHMCHIISQEESQTNGSFLSFTQCQIELLPMLRSYARRKFLIEIKDTVVAYFLSNYEQV